MNPFIRPRAVQDPALRVFAFHHAGGSAATYYHLARALPADWELLLLDLPGRGKRHKEQPLERVEEVFARVVADLEPHLDGTPAALFGHSFGALVALEVSRALDGRGQPPQWVGVSGRVPPGHRHLTRLSELNDHDLMRELRVMGGTPDAINEMPQFVERFLRIIRSDLRAVESYRPAVDRAPLSCPLTVFCGRDDLWAPPSAMSNWALETRHEPRHRFFSGGHFYFTGSAMDRLTHAITDEIQAVTTVPVT